MLFLTFQLGKDRYAIEANRVLEVLPLLEIKPLPHAPKGIAGTFNLRGRPVPALDLNELTFGLPARHRLTTRIILMEHADANGQPRLLGLIAEYVTQAIRKERSQFVDPGVTLKAAPYLGPILMDSTDQIQLLYPEHLVSEPIRKLLCTQPAAMPSAAPDRSQPRDEQALKWQTPPQTRVGL